MTDTSIPAGRRERNKQAKLERIIAAASTLFAERGVDDVTTQQIADAADIGTGTLFLYAKTKGELLLLVQNAHYEEALGRGRAAADGIEDRVDALMAIIGPIVECNRVHIDNGRSYLREMVFGDPFEPRHAEALAIAAKTEAALAAVIARGPEISAAEAAALARAVSSVMFLTMAAGINATADTEALLDDIRTQVSVLTPRAE